MTTWNGNPEDFEKEYESILIGCTGAGATGQVTSFNDVEEQEVVGAVVTPPQITEFDMKLDERIRAAQEQHENEQYAQKQCEDEMIEKEWENAGGFLFTHQEALEAAEEVDTQFIGYNVPVDFASDQVTYTTTSTGFAVEGDIDEDYIDEDYITVSEFKDFIYDLIESKGGALPDVKDWKEIKTMMELMYEGENAFTTAPDDEDEDEYYGCNEDSVAVGESDVWIRAVPNGEVSLYHGSGTAKFTTTVNGAEIKDPDVGDIFLNSADNQWLIYNGSSWVVS